MLLAELVLSSAIFTRSRLVTTDLDLGLTTAIDGVYYNPDGHPPYIIVEAKYGGSRLSYLKQDGKIKTAIDEFGNLFKRKQMDEQWIRDRLKDAVGKQKYRDILKVMEDGDVTCFDYCKCENLYS